MKKNRSVAVFLGPSMQQEHAQQILQAEYLPPAQQGDIYRILPSGIQTVVLIDGMFHSTPSIWHREIVDAMSEGVQVIGASSIGALRAAELDGLGMRGIGKVYEWYRDGFLDGDDEVALLHASEELDFRALSDPLVNIRFTLGAADCALPEVRVQELLAYAKALFYGDRSWPGLLDSPVVAKWSDEERNILDTVISHRLVDQKQMDATNALKYVAQQSRHEAVSVPGCYVPLVNIPARRQSRFMANGFNGLRDAATGAELLKKVYRVIDKQSLESMIMLLRQRQYVGEWAVQNGQACPSDYLEDFNHKWNEKLSEQHGAEWMQKNGLTLSLYETLIAERASVEWILENGPCFFGIPRVTPADEADSTVHFIEDWARQKGITSPDAHPLSSWVLEMGPAYFGVGWSAPAALLTELQLTGRACEILEGRG
ncbi:hypothetical protein FKG94_06330 [Exilibacterium tricleocarpae]|uniref:TfuA-like core domain-containing protein n=1 Tax=Exilibacterium tricleocarpae TaxID=2591008 RepID=A0A545U472_9GAMM|nr:TfuA-like protein [Exilibacterium tricleocarpae]TQV84270.1 hypothetical protein FKG94_06330 [Exilibacterium tricleocarpae]